MSTTTRIGETKVYKTSTGKLIDSKTASTSKMSAKRMAASTASSVDVRFSVLATNPFCQSFGNAIEAVFSINVKKSDSFHVFSGEHRLMPNHEVYVPSNTGGWATVYRRQYANVACLVKVECPVAKMSGAQGRY